MFRKKQMKTKKTEIIFWGVFYLNLIAIRETDQFKRDITRIVKSIRPVSYEFEELTAFIIIRTHINLQQSIEKLRIDEINTNKNSANEIFNFIKDNLEEAYHKYLKSLTERFLKDINKNRELKEATSIIIRKLALTEDDKEEFTKSIYQLIEEKTENYLEIIQNSVIYINNTLTENHYLIELSGERIEIKSDESFIHILDELILFNFASNYTDTTKEILNQFNVYIKNINSHLRKVKEKSKELEELLDLLKGKSFEVIDNIFDIRRQIARQVRADDEITREIGKTNIEEFMNLITKFSSKKNFQEIVKNTNEINQKLNKWFEHIRKIELIKDITLEIEITTKFNEDICNLFTYMELLRMWSEFFYDISYFTMRKGRVLDSTDEEVKSTIETDAVLVVEDVYKTYKLPKSRVYALRGVSFKIKKGEVLAIMGPSGAGKTTLVNILTGLDSPDKGAVYLNGKNIALMDDTELTEFRRDQIGLVFQFYQLFAELTALENVSMPPEMANVPVKEARIRAQEILEVVDLGSFANQYPDKLSGGQQQRVAIARALVNEPSIVVADQLTGDLDSVTGMQIIGYLRKINTEKGVTILLVTHNKAVATQADRIITIEDGELLEEIDMTAIRNADQI